MFSGIYSMSTDMRDIGRIIKYFILVSILYSIILSGTGVMYTLMMILSYISYVVIYPFKAIFSEIFIDFSISSPTSIADPIQETFQETIQNIPIIENTNVIGTYYSTTIGKIIRALIGPRF